MSQVPKSHVILTRVVVKAGDERGPEHYTIASSFVYPIAESIALPPCPGWLSAAGFCSAVLPQRSRRQERRGPPYVAERLRQDYGDNLPSEARQHPRKG
jgi:hypothetical protein